MGRFAHVPPYRRRQSTPSSLFCVYSSTQSPGATSSSSVYTLFVQVKPSGQDATQQSILTITAEQACEMLVYRSRSPSVNQGQANQFRQIQSGVWFFLLPVSPSLPPYRIWTQDVHCQGPWNHPAVVFAKYEDDGEQYVRIQLCTTFGSQRVEDRKHKSLYDRFALADNDQDTLTHGTLSLAIMTGPDRFTRRAYVDESEYDIELKHLDSWEKKSKFQMISQLHLTLIDNAKPPVAND
jgi:hypothetical protein